MHLCIIFLLCVVVYGVRRISEPDLKAVNFADKIKGHKLNGSIIGEVEVDSENSCQLRCVEEEQCQSYKCQLSGSDRLAGFANLTADKDFIYRGIKVFKIHFS